jgi:hypothetical protein
MYPESSARGRQNCEGKIGSFSRNQVAICGKMVASIFQSEEKFAPLFPLWAACMFLETAIDNEKL